MKLWNELRERRLVQLVLSYIAAGWALLSVADQLADRGVLPELAYQVVLVWYLAGMPAALLIGWHHGEKGRQRAPVSEILVLLVLLTGALGFTGRAVSRQQAARQLASSAEDALALRSIAVRYLVDESPTGGYDYLADGLTEALISELQQVNGLDVVSRNGTIPFRGVAIPSDSLAELLQVGTIVEGDITANRDRVRINLQITDGKSGTTIQRVTIEEPTSDLATLRESVVTETARLLRQWIGNEVRVRQRLARAGNNTAWLQLQRAEKVRKDAEAHVRNGDQRAAEALFRSADEMLAKAESADRGWPDPVIERGAIAYRQAYLSQGAPEAAVPLIETAIAHAERALAIDRNSARAFEVRGTASYLWYLLQVVADPDAQQRLRERARSDLETAVQYDATLASAHATLSHIYMADNIADAVLAAGRAYEQDAYLESADLVLWRLFTGSLELEQFSKASLWCDEGARRFPQSFRFVSCQLRLMTTPGAKPDVARAWQLLARQDSLTPPPRLALEHARAQMSVAGAIARAGLPDSARAVLDRVARTVTPEVDRMQDLLPVEAYIRVLTGEKERAVELLSRYAAGNPQVLEGTRGEVQWWWRDLQDNPRFRRLIGLQ